MKTIFSIFILLITLMSQARETFKSIAPYKILSDTIVIDVADGFCRVKGQVTINGIPYVNGMVANKKMTAKTKTDSLGNYELIVPSSTKIIFFYGFQHSEIIINPYNFKSQHEVVIDFYTQHEEEIIMVDKPVIYCYSSKPIDASIQLDFKGDLTFTYPIYHQGWNVQVDINGIYDKGSQKNYPYLFWEGEMNGLTFLEEESVKKGSIIEKTELIPFLEKQLLNLGLNQQEQTDFITFWAPRMMKFNYLFVQFIVDEEYAENIAEINVQPKPDNMRRVYMLFSGHNNQPKFECIPQEFKSFERSGFTLIEWGGSEI